jgi:tetratricopeptide (TPR) repeat protein
VRLVILRIRFTVARMALSAALLAAVGCAVAHPTRSRDGTASLPGASDHLDGSVVLAVERGSTSVAGNGRHGLARWRDLVESARRRGALAEISGSVEQRARDGPGNAEAWYALGILRSAQGRHGDAADALSRAHSIQGDEAEIEYRWGAALLGADRPAEARKPLSRAVELAPEDAAPRVALAVCLAALGERAAALEAMRDLPRLSPSPADAARAVRLARALTDPFRGLDAARRAALEPAVQDLERDAPGPALSHLELVLARFPAVAAGYLLSALAAERLGESLRAVDELRKAAALAPHLPQPHAYLARLSARDRPEVAALEYEEAVKRNPLDPTILRRLGEIDLDRLGRASRGADWLGRAAQLVPDDAELQILAARAEVTAGSFAAAGERVSKAIRMRAGVARLLLRLAAAAYDERTRAAGQAARDFMTQCIETVLRAVEEVDPENAVARGLKRATHEG